MTTQIFIIFIYFIVVVLTHTPNAKTEKILSCYYTYNNPPIDRLDLTLCTHILLIGEVTINHQGFYVVDDEKKIIDFTTIKKQNPKIRLMLSVTGKSAHWSRMVSSDNSLQRFADDTYKHLIKHRLDGLDLDWEFPSWGSGSKKTDRQRLTLLLKELRDKFGNKLLLTMATSGPPTITRKSYDIKALNRYCDFVQVMNYDFHVFSWFNPVTGFNAPLRKFSKEPGIIGQMNSEASMAVYGALGLDRNKTVFGIPVYNLAFRLVNYYMNWPYAPAVGEVGGFGTYKDVCNITNGSNSIYKKYWSDAAASPYITGTDKVWITSEDRLSVALKAGYARDIGCAGVMVFQLITDDVENACGEGRYPLINSVKKAFFNKY